MLDLGALDGHGVLFYCTVPTQVGRLDGPAPAVDNLPPDA